MPKLLNEKIYFIENMNKKRHKLLGVLAKEYANANTEGSILDVIVTVPTILKKLKISYDEFIFMSEELKASGEIKYFQVENHFDSPAFYIESKGITSYANRRYLRVEREELREDIKFWAQLILPVLSFLIAAIALYLNMKTQSDINTVKKSQKTENVLK